jgi:dTMP kinase
MDVFGTLNLTQQRESLEEGMRREGSVFQEKARKQAEAEAQKKAQEEAATAQGFVAASKLGKDQLAEMERLKQQSEGKGLMSALLAQRQQAETERQIKGMAYARGYNPMAERGAAFKSSEARSAIRDVAQVQAEQEKAQALQDYSQMAQYQQQMAFTGEQAKKNYLMGNRELSEQQAASMANYKAALAEIDSRRKMAEAARKNALTNALISAGAGIAATVATGGNVGAGFAASTATGALLSQRQ